MPRPPRSPAPAPRRHAHGGEGQVRIIGGRWRNTRLPVPYAEGLRPTSDRVRETLFNWLMPKLPGARVLDLFAGSGALGLEAVSRGAASAQLVERDPALVAALRDVVVRLDAAAQVQVAAGDALRWLETAPAQQADIVFVDPPFADGMWAQVFERLPRHLAADAWLYVEAPSGAVPRVPAGWSLHREGGTRDVGYALYRRAAATLRDDLNATPSA
ncbi:MULTISPECIES: 16S rRNA (guanine(966)-N(2))-methyltransferase RsmD [Stenotrophomonas]|uniref:Ribosomal RNA small subunit methyltransferase D n=1 Tax=Stenotrophomonas nitritireducens TaxID=83617 RepID=A0ABR5NNN4_9GAMM|nr:MULTISPECIES: 16S rRNA (guanine(966)-N(2))-methyltransferase RsmD [Stenotrophomonas]KQN98191.1 16S rRNA (guanine(966)-N(2))-methyltransferase RsmD [Stenotrophomonas sp. Leaf70]KRG60326.1 methyltransferase [Stenotrophomonas nitritireducens]